jgi:hypothetical protein
MGWQLHQLQVTANPLLVLQLPARTTMQRCCSASRLLIVVQHQAQ